MTQLTEYFAHRSIDRIFRGVAGDWRPAETHVGWLTNATQGSEQRTTNIPMVRIDHDATTRNFWATAATGSSIANTGIIAATASAAVQDVAGIGLYDDAAGTNLLASGAFTGGARDVGANDLIRLRPGELVVRFPTTLGTSFALNAFCTAFLNGWLRRDANAMPSTWFIQLMRTLPTDRSNASAVQSAFVPRAQLLPASLGAPASKVCSNTAVIQHAAATQDEPSPALGTVLYDAATNGTPYLAGAFLPPGFQLPVLNAEQAQIDAGRLSLGIL